MTKVARRLRIFFVVGLTACTAKTATTRTEQVKTCAYLAPDQMQNATASTYRETMVHCLITRYNWTVDEAEGSEDVAETVTRWVVAMGQIRRAEDSMARAADSVRRADSEKQWIAAAPRRERARRQSWVTCYLHAAFATEIAACSKGWLTTRSDSVWAEKEYPGLRATYVRSESIWADSLRRSRPHN